MLVSFLIPFKENERIKKQDTKYIANMIIRNEIYRNRKKSIFRRFNSRFLTKVLMNRYISRNNRNHDFAKYNNCTISNKIVDGFTIH